MSAVKPDLRKRYWAAIREAGAARFPGVEGRIPNFVGAEAAARRLAETAEFRAARVLKCNPDLPQRPVRHAALKAGKVVVLAVPKLRDAACFVLLDPAEIPEKALWSASSIKGAATHGRPLRPAEVPRIDLVVSGCVAAGEDGARLGKGGGYADLELALLLAAGRVDPDVPIATTVHDCQVAAAGAVPVEAHDSTLDLVVTPTRTVRPRPRLPRPAGVLWERLSDERIAAMPALAALRRP